MKILNKKIIIYFFGLSVMTECAATQSALISTAKEFVTLKKSMDALQKKINVLEELEKRVQALEEKEKAREARHALRPHHGHHGRGGKHCHR